MNRNRLEAMSSVLLAIVIVADVAVATTQLSAGSLRSDGADRPQQSTTSPILEPADDAVAAGGRTIPDHDDGGRLRSTVEPRSAVAELAMAAGREKSPGSSGGVQGDAGPRPSKEEVVEAAQVLGVEVGDDVDAVDVAQVAAAAAEHVKDLLAGLGLDSGARVDDGDWERAGAAVGVHPRPQVDSHYVARVFAAVSGGRGSAVKPSSTSVPPGKATTAAFPAPQRLTAVRRLYVAVGHGRTPDGKWDPGAIGRDGVDETVAGQVVVDEMTRLLARQPGLAVAAEAGDHPNVVGSVASANAGRFHECISIHHEWAGAEPGGFAHWHPASRPAQVLADRLVEALEDIGIPRRETWHKPRPELYFLRESRCAAVLVEIGRIGDYDAGELKAVGRALAGAYIDHLSSDAASKAAYRSQRRQPPD